MNQKNKQMREDMLKMKTQMEQKENELKAEEAIKKK